MLLRQVWVSDFKGVDALIPWADLVVLFGRNDAGKTNILEAVGEEWPEEDAGERARLLALDLPRPPRHRVDPCRGVEGRQDVEVLIELEHLELPGSPDGQILARLLQARHVPPLFPYYVRDVDIGIEPWEEDTLGDAGERRLPPAQLRWMGDEDSPFVVICAVEPGSDDLASLDDAIAALRAQALERLDDARPGWRAVEAEVLTVLDCCLASSWLRAGSHGVAWMTPRPVGLSGDVRAAAAVVHRAEPALPIVGDFVEFAAERRDAQVPFLLVTDHRFVPWRVVTISAAPERLDELAKRVEAHVLYEAEWPFHWEDRPIPHDPWLLEDDDGRFGLSEAVLETCARLTRAATDFAPAFIADSYDICVEPLAPTYWRDYDGRRIRLALRRRGASDTHDLKIVGSGLAAWAALTIEEVLRTPDEFLLEPAEVDSYTDDGFVDLDTTAVDESDEPSLPRILPSGSIGVLYVLDEPERHLHPRAQESAAEWIVRLTQRRGASAVLASHALPFLSLPTDEAEYVLVTRDRYGISRAQPITDDLFGALDLFADEAGLGSRAQALLAARGILIVEGAHDAAVLHHFFRTRFERARVLLLPTRGAKKAQSLIEAEFLAMLDLPMVILYDDIRAEMLEAETPPSRRNVAAYELWQLLRHWPQNRRRPRVVSFPLPDIFAALPDACVRRAIERHGGRFDGWDAVVADFRTGKHEAFKQFFLERSGLPRDTNPSSLLSEMLETCRDLPRSELDAAVARALDATAVGPARN